MSIGDKIIYQNKIWEVFSIVNGIALIKEGLNFTTVLTCDFNKTNLWKKGE